MINKFINYINNMNVVGAVLIKDNKIILPKRSDTLLKYPGFYEFPGGKVEKDETLKEALKRELCEELSIDVEADNIEEFENNVFKNDKLILTIFIVKKWKNEIIIDPKIHSMMISVDYKDLNNVEDLLNTDKQLIPAVLKAV